ncbi:MAG: inositol monophosphatase family protein [Bacteroidota bacterium]
MTCISFQNRMLKMMPELNDDYLLEETIAIAKEAGRFLRDHVGKVRSEEIEDKDRNSLVSYVDRETEKMIVSALRELLPESTFITEEDTIENQESEYTWIIDPLDGTTNFLFNIPHFSTSIALQHRGELVVGVVYDVSLDECFSARKGGGAFLNGQAIKVRQAKSFQDSIIATGFPFDDAERVEKGLNLVRHIKLHTRGMRRLGSAALDLAYVAAGRFDAYLEAGINAWDVAAGALLVQEAGGIVKDLDGNDEFLHRQQILASSPAVQKDVLEMSRLTFL